MAMNHYREQDYDVTDVGARESYDIHAIAGDQERHIEVKGTTMDATHVELTTAEVRHARSGLTDLVVVDQIQWERLPDGTVATSGGRYHSWADWQPTEADLQPSRYQYRLPR